MGLARRARAVLRGRNVVATVPVPFFRSGKLVVRRKRGQAPSPRAVFLANTLSRRRSQSPFSTVNLAR